MQYRGATEPIQPQVFISTGLVNSAGLVNGRPAPTQYLIVRTTGDPAVLLDDLRAIIRDTRANTAVDQVLMMDMRVMTSLSRPRMYAVLLVGFATFSAFIAGTGLFAGLSYSVAQRRREIGVRMALGAAPRDILSLVLKQGILLSLTGVVLGLGLAAVTVRYLASFLFGVTPFDRTTFTVVGTALLITALVACVIPARRPAKIDALVALTR